MLLKKSLLFIVKRRTSMSPVATINSCSDKSARRTSCKPPMSKISSAVRVRRLMIKRAPKQEYSSAENPGNTPQTGGRYWKILGKAWKYWEIPQQTFCSDLEASTFESVRAKNRLSSSLETKEIVTGNHKKLARRPHGEDRATAAPCRNATRQS